MQYHFFGITWRTDHHLPLAVYRQVFLTITAANLEDISRLTGTTLYKSLNFVKPAPYVKPGLGRIIRRRVRVKMPQQQLSVFIPESGSELPVSE
jgi:hypothetical protein